VEIQPLSNQDSALLFTSLARPIAPDELGHGEGKPTDRLAKHETLLAMKGNPGLIVEAAEYLSVTKKLDLSGLKDEIPRLKEIMEKEDSEEMADTKPANGSGDHKHNDDDDYTPKKPAKPQPDDDWTPKKPGKSSSSGNLASQKSVEQGGLEHLFRQYGISQSGQSFWKFGDDVSCSTFFAKLNKEFVRRTGTSDRPLSKADYLFFKGLLNKRFKNNSDEIVHLQAFGGFWNWFEAFSEIIAEIPELWSSTDPCVVYLCTSAEAQEELARYRPGTFLIRFSESKVGYISLAVKKKTTTEHLLVYKDEGGWNHDGDSVEDVYATVPELLLSWKAGKYIGSKPKSDVLQILGSNVSRGGEDSDEGPD
jgi:hypothetical protein